MRSLILRILTLAQVNSICTWTSRGNAGSKCPLRLMPLLPAIVEIRKQESLVTSLSLKRKNLHLVSSAATPSVLGAIAANGSYEPMGQGVSICFSRVGANGYTWLLRNESFVTVTTLRFRSSYISSETGRSAYDDGFVPARLEPGQSIGGWDAWGVYSCTPPHVQILEIERIVHRLHRRYREL
jgi:hypothetical protein